MYIHSSVFFHLSGVVIVLSSLLFVSWVKKPWMELTNVNIISRAWLPHSDKEKRCEHAAQNTASVILLFVSVGIMGARCLHYRQRAPLRCCAMPKVCCIEQAGSWGLVSIDTGSSECSTPRSWSNCTQDRRDGTSGLNWCTRPCHKQPHYVQLSTLHPITWSCYPYL